MNGMEIVATGIGIAVMALFAVFVWRIARP
jgi:hypothetical protein